MASETGLSREARKTAAAQYERRRSLLGWLVGGLFVLFVVAGWFVPQLGFLVPLCMIGSIVPAFWLGRRWCGSWCPRGRFLGQWLAPLSRNRPIPRLLRSVPFRVAVLATLMTVFGIRLYQLWPTPVKVGGFFILFLTITTVVGVLLGLIYKPRTWCAFCPMGTLAKWAGTGKNPLRVTSGCTSCKLCQRVCPLGIAPYEFREAGVVGDWDCLKCNRCTVHCPQQALGIGACELREAA